MGTTRTSNMQSTQQQSVEITSGAGNAASSTVSTIPVHNDKTFAAVIEAFDRHRACAVLRTTLEDTAEPAMEAAVKAGFKVIEFTMTTPGCLDMVKTFSTKYPDIVVGCGTVMDTLTAERAVAAGADFIVAPVLDASVVQWCAARRVVCIPGCATPTELQTAYTLGAPIQKLFPGVAGGAGWIKAVSAALPHLRINPTSGVTEESAQSFLANGAFSLGFVACLFDAKDMSERNFDAIGARAARMVQQVETAPRPAKGLKAKL